MQRNQILTHRGLEPSKESFYSESSYDAFINHLQRGFGIEFDVNFTKNNKIIIVHDKTAERITKGKDKRPFTQIRSTEIPQLENGRIPLLDELIDIIRNNNSAINALHLKGRFQKQAYLDLLLENLEKHKDILDKILIFDVKPEVAKYLIGKNDRLILAPSVGHLYDISRYNSAVFGTLISVEDAIQYRKFFKWVWLDEWDLSDKDGNTKKFYARETFAVLKNVGYKIALVTPELHGTSPGLLGCEAHPDAKNKQVLFKRIKEIIYLRPDAICTDYPEEVLHI